MTTRFPRGGGLRLIAELRPPPRSLRISTTHGDATLFFGQKGKSYVVPHAKLRYYLAL